MEKSEAARTIASGALWGLGAGLVGVLIQAWADRRKALRDEEQQLFDLLEKLDAAGYVIVRRDEA